MCASARPPLRAVRPNIVLDHAACTPAVGWARCRLMDWPTWQQGVATAVACALAVMLLRRMQPTRVRDAMRPAVQELGLLAALYTIWRLARTLPLATTSGALQRARRIDWLQHRLHFPSELSLQHLVLRHEWLGRFLNSYYAIVHVPALIAFLVWLFVRHRDAYPRWRNALAIVTGLCLVIRFVRVAPPRFLPDLGYIDLASRFGMSVYGPVGTGVSDQFAAMPSIHVGWAAVVSFGIVAASTSRWRWLFLFQVVLTSIAVSATGNHWWLDGLVAVALLGLALAVDTRVRAMSATHQRRTLLGEEPGLDPVGGELDGLVVGGDCVVDPAGASE
jgi:PAP2 superfamily